MFMAFLFGGQLLGASLAERSCFPMRAFYECRDDFDAEVSGWLSGIVTRRHDRFRIVGCRCLAFGLHGSTSLLVEPAMFWKVGWDDERVSQTRSCDKLLRERSAM
jgi:hypothetical protein